VNTENGKQERTQERGFDTARMFAGGKRWVANREIQGLSEKGLEMG
jgi:hypothetical protein